MGIYLAWVLDCYILVEELGSTVLLSVCLFLFGLGSTFPLYKTKAKFFSSTKRIFVIRLKMLNNIIRDGNSRLTHVSCVDSMSVTSLSLSRSKSKINQTEINL